jgi:hypothetical protein
MQLGYWSVDSVNYSPLHQLILAHKRHYYLAIFHNQTKDHPKNLFTNKLEVLQIETYWKRNKMYLYPNVAGSVGGARDDEFISKVNSQGRTVYGVGMHKRCR